MNSFLRKFEAFEARVASSCSYSCPRGVSGRIHVLRLRNRFQHPRRSQSAVPYHAIKPPKQEHRDEGTWGPEKELWEKSAPKSFHQNTEELVTYSAETLSIVEHGKERIRGDVLQDPDELYRTRTPTNFSTLLRALQTRDPHAVMGTLLAHIHDTGMAHTSKILKEIPDNTFSEILRYIDPEHFIGRWMELQTEVSPRYAEMLGISKVDVYGCHRFCSQFLNQIRAVMDLRQKSGGQLTVSDFKILLKSARFAGNKKVAEDVWWAMQANQNSLTPDIECYNHYLATLCWADALIPIYRNRLRVIPTNIDYRHRGIEESHYTLGGYQVGEFGIRNQVSHIFRSMVEAGLHGNEETFSLMMVALGREGDLKGISSILKRVWNIDVEGLMGGNEADLPPVKDYYSDSPFYPSENLLMAIAHAYGSNNSIPTALRLIDYLSRQYTLRISDEIWKQLLEWTFVVSTKRHGKRLEDGRTMGQLPAEAVTSLWSTMISEPYNVKPSMKMYDYLIGNLISRQRFGEVQERIQEAIELNRAYIHKLFETGKALDQSAAIIGHSLSNHSRQRSIRFLKVRIAQNRQYIRRWIVRLLDKGCKKLNNPDFTTRNIPNIVRYWKTYLPQQLTYPVSTGYVRLHHGGKTENKLTHLKIEYMRWKLRFKHRSIVEKRLQSWSGLGGQGLVRESRRNSRQMRIELSSPAPERRPQHRFQTVQ